MDGGRRMGQPGGAYQPRDGPPRFGARAARSASGCRRPGAYTLDHRQQAQHRPGRGVAAYGVRPTGPGGFGRFSASAFFSGCATVPCRNYAPICVWPRGYRRACCAGSKAAPAFLADPQAQRTGGGGALALDAGGRFLALSVGFARGSAPSPLPGSLTAELQQNLPSLAGFLPPAAIHATGRGDPLKHPDHRRLSRPPDAPRRPITSNGIDRPCRPAQPGSTWWHLRRREHAVRADSAVSANALGLPMTAAIFGRAGPVALTTADWAGLSPGRPGRCRGTGEVRGIGLAA